MRFALPRKRRPASNRRSGRDVRLHDAPPEQRPTAPTHGPVRAAAADRDVSAVGAVTMTKRQRGNAPEPGLGEFGGHATTVCTKGPTKPGNQTYCLIRDIPDTMLYG
jgi:hypothetical protein